MRLHIGVDAWNLADDRRGIGRYVRTILSRWARRSADRVRTTLIIPQWFTWLEKGRYLKTLDCGPLPVRHRSSVRRCGYDALWFPWNGLSWSAPGLKIATVHDGYFFASPPNDLAVAAREQLPVRNAAAEAERIITDSEFSKTELIKYLVIDPDRIDVVQLGVDESLLLDRHDPARFEGAKRYVLFVGELEARKGIDTLLEAAARLPESLRSDTVIAIAGRLSERPDLHGHPVPPPPPNVRMELLGHVSDERLHSLYAGAAAFVFPSRYEGFGLPVLEAMACGAPVIASNAASIPEAGGDAALYFPVGDGPALAVAIERVLTDAALAERLREAGRQRAAQMSWDATADLTLEVIERVVASSQRCCFKRKVASTARTNRPS